MKDKLAIIVPYRDREKHLNVFVPHMHNFLKDKGISYDIFIAEQADDRPFNYGKLCNAAVKEVGEEYTYFAFHDIDMLPISDDCDYGYPDVPTHLATNVEAHDNKLPYPQYFGGVVLINREDFERANGYSNEYWGYGFEDLDLLYRLQKSGAYLEKFYDTNKTYSKYDEDDILPYRIEKVNITNKDKSLYLNCISLKDTFIKSPMSLLFKNVVNESFSFTLWFKNEVKSNKKKNILTFEGYDSGFFISEDNMLIAQVWDKNLFNHELSVKYKFKEWNHITFNLDFENKELIIYLNNKKFNLRLPRDFKINDYTRSSIKISDEDSNIEIANLAFFNHLLNDDDVKNFYFEGFQIFSKIKNNKILIPVSYYTFDSFYKNQFILDKGKYHNHLRIEKITTTYKHTINLHDEIYLPSRLDGEYKSLTHVDDRNIIDKYYKYDPDIEENSDIFFHDVLTGNITYDQIGLKQLKYKILDKKDFDDYKLLRIVT